MTSLVSAERSQPALRPARNPAVLLVAGLWSVALAWMPFVGLQLDGLFGGTLVAAATLGLVAVFYARIRGEPRIAEASGYVALWLLFSLGGCILTYLAATPALPLQDTAYRAWDAAIGFDWAAWTAWIRRQPELRDVLRLAYGSLPLQIAGTAVILAFAGRTARNRQLLTAAAVGLLITTLVWTLLPAMGPFALQPLPGTLPADIRYIPDVEALRAPGPDRFAVEELQGIIVFPSYHTVLGVLFVWAHRGLRWSFPPVLLLNVLMLASVPSEGGHYLVDLLAGLLVAAVAIAVARRIA